MSESFATLRLAMEADDEATEVVEKLGITFEDTAMKTVKSNEGMGSSWEELNEFFESGTETWFEFFMVQGKVTEATEAYGNDLKSLKEDQAAYNKKLEESSATNKIFNRDLLAMAKGVLGVATAYGAGRWLVNMAKDTIKAAKAAGIAEELFARWDETTNRLKVSIGTRLVNALESSLSSVLDYIEAQLDVADATNILIDMTDAEAESLGILIKNEGLASTAFDILTGEQVSNVEVLHRQIEAQGQLIEKMVDSKQRAEEVTDTWMLYNESLAESDIARITLDIAEADRLAAEETENLAGAVDTLKASFFPLTEQIEEFKQSIEDLTLEGEELAAEFGLLEFLTPEQQTEIGLLKSELTGVWIEFNKIIELIKNEDLGTKQLADAETQAADLRLEMGRLEAEIIALGGVPYVTEEQETEARNRLNEIEGEIDDLKTAWQEQTNQMIFNMTEQSLALDGFTREELDFLNRLAGPEGLGLIDATTVALQDTIIEVTQNIEGEGDAAFEAILKAQQALVNLDGTESFVFVTTVETTVPAGAPGVPGSPGSAGSGRPGTEPTTEDIAGFVPGFGGDIINVTVEFSPVVSIADELEAEDRLAPLVEGAIRRARAQKNG